MRHEKAASQVAFEQKSELNQLAALPEHVSNYVSRT